MKNRVLKIKKFAASLLIAFVASLGISISAQAATVGFTYNGTGIRDLYSIGATHVDSGKTITVDHHQTKNEAPSTRMTVYVVKQNWWGGWDNIGSKAFTGSTSGKITVTANGSGTYKLHFVSTDPPHYTFNINGTFYK